MVGAGLFSGFHHADCAGHIGWMRSERRIRHNTEKSHLGDRASRPFLALVRDKPPNSSRVKIVRRPKQAQENVCIKQPWPQVRSSLKSVHLPGATCAPTSQPDCRQEYQRRETRSRSVCRCRPSDLGGSTGLRPHQPGSIGFAHIALPLRQFRRRYSRLSAFPISTSNRNFDAPSRILASVERIDAN